MEVVIQIVGLATGQPCDPCYVREYSADGHEGRGYLSVTSEVERAKRYPDISTALTAWRSVSTTHPLRIDGKQQAESATDGIHRRVDSV